MEGLTIEEMAKRLRVPYKTVAQRILRGNHEPIFSGNLYSEKVYEAIKESRGKGRPKKPKPDIAEAIEALKFIENAPLSGKPKKQVDKKG